MAAFAVAVATGDIIKYQSFVYGSFVWEIHVRYNNNKYVNCTRNIILILNKTYTLIRALIVRTQKGDML